MAPAGTVVAVGGRTLTLTNLDKVLYPEVGFTKAQVIDYYARIAPVMVPHLHGRALTFTRYPNGTDKQGFFEKNCPKHAPDWIPISAGPGHPPTQNCRIEEPAALVWAGNQAAIEIHTPMALAADLDQPRLVVFDLDPGAPAAMRECAVVAQHIRELVGALGFEVWAKTSGSKGLQVYLPVNAPVTQEDASSFALAVAQLLERQLPALVVSVMTKQLRTGKVLVDWSQNSLHKTTIGVYSLRARPAPTVSTPVTWDEVDAAAEGATDLRFEAADVLARVAAHGDLFAPTLTVVQPLPQLTGRT